MLGDHSREPYRASPSLKISTRIGLSSTGTPHRSASAWNSPMSLLTRSIVNEMSREPLRITWLSVSWTNEFPEEIRIASHVVSRSSPAAFAVTIASQQDTRLAVAR